MGTGATEINQLTIAALSVPIIVLVVTLSIDSVEKQDSIDYRVGVGSWGLATLISALLLITVAIGGEVTGELGLNLFLYLFLTFFSAFVLVMYVILHELLRGVDPETLQYRELLAKTAYLIIATLAFFGSISILQLTRTAASVIPVVVFAALLGRYFDRKLPEPRNMGDSDEMPEKKLKERLIQIGILVVVGALSWELVGLFPLI